MSECRVCFVRNVRLHPISKTWYQEMYEKLSCCKLSTEDGRPENICYICNALLEKFKNFFVMSQNSEKILTKRLIYGAEMFQVAQDKSHNLGTTAVKSISFLDDGTDEPEVTVTIKEEVEDFDEWEMFKEEFMESQDEIPNSPVESSPEELPTPDDVPEKTPTQLPEENTDYSTDRYIKTEPVETNEDLPAAAQKLIQNLSEALNIPITNIKHPKTNQESNIQCSKCNYRCRQVRTLRRHAKVHDPNNTYICKLCTYRFVNEKKLATHKNYCTVCSICNKQFHNIHSLRIHVRLHTGEQPYSCDACGRGFNQKTNLQTHLRVHAREKQYPCEICHKVFPFDSYLKRHMMIHSERAFDDSSMQQIVNCHKLYNAKKERKQFKCQECGKKLLSKDSLLMHMMLHTGERPFSCERCGKSFIQKCNMHVHIERVHPGDELFSCKVCYKTYPLNSELRRHMATHKTDLELKRELLTEEENLEFLLSGNGVKAELLSDADVKDIECVILTKTETMESLNSSEDGRDFLNNESIETNPDDTRADRGLRIRKDLLTDTGEVKIRNDLLTKTGEVKIRKDLLTGTGGVRLRKDLLTKSQSKHGLKRNALNMTKKRKKPKRKYYTDEKQVLKSLLKQKAESKEKRNDLTIEIVNEIKRNLLTSADGKVVFFLPDTEVKRVLPTNADEIVIKRELITDTEEKVAESDMLNENNKLEHNFTDTIEVKEFEYDEFDDIECSVLNDTENEAFKRSLLTETEQELEIYQLNSNGNSELQCSALEDTQNIANKRNLLTVTEGMKDLECDELNDIDNSDIACDVLNDIENSVTPRDELNYTENRGIECSGVNDNEGYAFKRNMLIEADCVRELECDKLNYTKNNDIECGVLNDTKNNDTECGVLNDTKNNDTECGVLNDTKDESQDVSDCDIFSDTDGEIEAIECDIELSDTENYEFHCNYLTNAKINLQSKRELLSGSTEDVNNVEGDSKCNSITEEELADDGDLFSDTEVEMQDTECDAVLPIENEMQLNTLTDEVEIEFDPNGFQDANCDLLTEGYIEDKCETNDGNSAFKRKTVADNGLEIKKEYSSDTDGVLGQDTSDSNGVSDLNWESFHDDSLEIKQENPLANGDLDVRSECFDTDEDSLTDTEMSSDLNFSFTTSARDFDMFQQKHIFTIHRKLGKCHSTPYTCDMCKTRILSY